MNAFIKSRIKEKVKPLMPESAYNYFVKWFDNFQVMGKPGVRFYKGVEITPLLEAAFDEIAFQTDAGPEVHGWNRCLGSKEIEKVYKNMIAGMACDCDFCNSITEDEPLPLPNQEVEVIIEGNNPTATYSKSHGWVVNFKPLMESYKVIHWLQQEASE